MAFDIPQGVLDAAAEVVSQASEHEIGAVILLLDPQDPERGMSTDSNVDLADMPHLLRMIADSIEKRFAPSRDPVFDLKNEHES